jgi:DNA-binding response OmpR family regulator
LPPMRVLFVDDEPGIRVSLPPILEGHGFHVTAAATVAEALSYINSQLFNVLIADLNIGEAGDGFTVVSAMRRTQPECVTFILTGYPGFQSALEAIRNQVDDYLIKPTHPIDLVKTVQQRLSETGTRHLPIPQKRLAAILSEHADEITSRTLNAMKANPELGRLTLTDEQRVDHLPDVIARLATMLDPGTPQGTSPTELKAAAEHGRERLRQDYELHMIVEDTRMLENVIYDVIQENLLAINLSYLVPDIKRLNDSLELQLKESLRSYQKDYERAA